MTIIATRVAIFRMSLPETAANVTHEAIDLSIPIRPKPLLDFPFILTYIAVVSTAIILIAKLQEILL